MHLIHQLWKWSSAVCRSFKQKYQILISWRKINTADNHRKCNRCIFTTWFDLLWKSTWFELLHSSIRGLQAFNYFLERNASQSPPEESFNGPSFLPEGEKNIVVITSAVLPTFLHIAPVFKTKNINKSGAFRQSTSKNSGIFYHQSHFCTSLFTISVKRQAKHLLACLY